jgi:apolipoprotein N-acyltransferase
MSDFNPLSIFYIASEMFGSWFWPLVVVALVLLYGVVSGFRRLRRRGLSAGGPLFGALVVGLVATVLAAWWVPSSTEASISALGGVIDYVMVIAMALAIGLGVFALVFSVMARKRASKQIKA